MWAGSGYRRFGVVAIFPVFFAGRTREIFRGTIIAFP